MNTRNIPPHQASTLQPQTTLLYSQQQHPLPREANKSPTTPSRPEYNSTAQPSTLCITVNLRMAQAPPGGGHKLYSLDDITKLMNSFTQPAVAMPPPPPLRSNSFPSKLKILL